jgi:hypothetical protein
MPDAWFFTLPHDKEIPVHVSDYEDALNEYRKVALELVGWREPRLQQQPTEVDLRPLLMGMKSTDLLFDRPFMAYYRGGQAYQFPDPLEFILANRTIDGTVSVLFLAGELPTLSAWDHGLYDRDYELITTTVELSNALEDFYVGDIDVDKWERVGTPPGLRVRRVGETLMGKCLVYSPISGFDDLTVEIASNGVAAKRELETVLRPSGPRFY